MAKLAVKRFLLSICIEYLVSLENKVRNWCENVQLSTFTAWRVLACGVAPGPMRILWGKPELMQNSGANTDQSGRNCGKRRVHGKPGPRGGIDCHLLSPVVPASTKSSVRPIQTLISLVTAYIDISILSLHSDWLRSCRNLACTALYRLSKVGPPKQTGKNATTIVVRIKCWVPTIQILPIQCKNWK